MPASKPKRGLNRGRNKKGLAGAKTASFNWSMPRVLLLLLPEEERFVDELQCVLVGEHSGRSPMNASPTSMMMFATSSRKLYEMSSIGFVR